MWLAWDRERNRCIGVEVGKRNVEPGKPLWKQFNLFEGSTVFTDYFPAYESIVENVTYVIGKAYIVD